MRWRQETTAGADAAEYIAMCRRMGEFSVENLEQVTNAGAALVLAVGGTGNAARQIQLIRFREPRYAREFVERTQHLYPEIASEIMAIYIDGEAPRYTPLPPKAAPEDGYLHNADHTVKILESMWGDIKQLEAFICGTTLLKFGERLGYIPTTAVPKRLPYRTFSGKCRTISDLGGINLGVDTIDSFPIRMTEIKGISERIVRKRDSTMVYRSKSAREISSTRSKECHCAPTIYRYSAISLPRNRVA